MTTFTYDHIHLRSTDPEKTAAWYARMLDAKIIRSTQQGQPRIDMKIGGQDVFIAPVPPNSGVNPPPVTPYQGLDHFGLRVTGGALILLVASIGAMNTSCPPILMSMRGWPCCVERMISASSMRAYQDAVFSGSVLRRWM